MKYIAVTFDDGRSDNYLLAKQIMDRYNLRGTVYITTGFVDGTWAERDILKSPTRPLKIEEILALQRSGWEIGLHGDKHQTQVADMKIALDKLQSWGVENIFWGMSIPNSLVCETEISELLRSEYGNRLLYIRRGRRCDTKKLSNRLLYCMYSVLNNNWAYRKFNMRNVMYREESDPFNIPSIVIKAHDKPEMIIDFLKHVPDGAMVVLMMHSILTPEHSLYGKDPWSWDGTSFEMLCSHIKHLENLEKVVCAPLMEIMKERC